MPRIVLKPRASSVVTPATSTAVSTTADQPLISTNASRAPRAIHFTPQDLDDPQKLSLKLNGLRQETYEELAALRAFPFIRGVLLKDIRVPGCMGQVDSISSANITLFRPYDALLFRAGDYIKAATTDGTTRGSIRNSGATAVVLRDGSVTGSTGTVTATGNWTGAIAALAAGDFLFLRNTVGSPLVYNDFTIQLDHRLGVTPTNWWVAETSRGTREPELTYRSSNESTLTLCSTRCAYVDIFVVG
jgi:hypothetical protein